MAAVLAAMLLAAVSAACVKTGRVYSRYQSMQHGGWLREDTVTITAGPVLHGGSYTEELGLRTNSCYPFTEIAVIVEQQAQPSGFSRKDTLLASLTDDNGLVTGEGISHYQYLFTMPPVSLAEGDTLNVSIRHDMRRNPLAGVTDVGITLKHSDL